MSKDKTDVSMLTRREALGAAAAACLALAVAPAGFALADDGDDLEAGSMEEAASSNPKAMYRLYNPNSGEHFYTASQKERCNVIRAGWNYEGVGWADPSGGDPVYRLYNANGGEHHYTTSNNEKNKLVKAGWKYEGVGWYSDKSKGVPVYREYNPNKFSCNHNYTTSLTEHKKLVSLGWKDEKIAWYGSAKSIPRTNPTSVNGANKNKASLTGVVIRKNETPNDTLMAWGCVSYFIVFPEPVNVTYTDFYDGTVTKQCKEIHITSKEFYTATEKADDIYYAYHPWAAKPDFDKYLGHEVTITGNLVNMGNAHCRGICKFGSYSISVLV